MSTQIIGEGGHDSRTFCTFNSVVCRPQEIKLPLGIGGISWSYKLNYNAVDTYGGQVVQILGISIENLSIRGNFGGENPQWGEVIRNVKGKEVLLDRFGDTRWIQQYDHPWANGIRQMGDWFRQYFQATTQGELGALSRPGQRFSQKAMVFTFPARGWKFTIRPTDFPQIQIDNQTLNPEWVVQADFVENLESDRSFLDDVTDFAYNQLSEMKVGVGFKRQNPFSEHLNEEITNIDLALEILDGWESTIWDGFSEEEIEAMSSLGYSIPANALDQAGVSPKDFEKDMKETGEAISDVGKQLAKSVKEIKRFTPEDFGF
jgi:hypothetical protein